MKRYFLGLAGGRKGEALRQVFIHGRERDYKELTEYLGKRYDGEAILMKNGRSALTVACEAYLPKGSAVLINGFTCFAVVEAVKAAGMKPVYADIDPATLNFSTSTLSDALEISNSGDSHRVPEKPGAIIVQNTLGNTVDMREIEKFAQEHGLIIIEDLAHSAGRFYPDGREAGTVGVATVLSFGKDKAIDTTSGGAVILRSPERIKGIKAPNKSPKLSDYLRERWYLVLAGIIRVMARVKLGGLTLKILNKLRMVELSADNRLNTLRRMTKFEARLALEQMKKLDTGVLREFCLVRDRDGLMRELKKYGYHFDGYWYERPVAPERYYKKAKFDETKCPVATEVAREIINLPTYFSKAELAKARKVIKRYLINETETGSGRLEEKWKEILKRFPEANFLQSPKYGKMNEILGEKAVYEEFGGVGWMLGIVRDAKRGRYLEIPCGPLIDWGNADVREKMAAKIREIAKSEKCVFVRMRPQLPATDENLKILESLGMKKAPMHLAAEHTVIVDLTKSEEELLAGMRRQTRYEVRRAGKMGILVTSGRAEADFREFHAVQAETAKRQGFVPPSLKTLMAEKEAFLDDITIYKAVTEEEEAIAYGLVIRGGEEADYYEAASTDLNRKLPGAYALLWQAILEAKKDGYKRFNLWGIAPAGQPNHRYAGVTTFKTGFPGETVEFVPAHDLVISGARYVKDYVVEVARKKKRRL